MADVASSRGITVSAHSQRVLVVEDDQGVRATVVDVLQSAGFQVAAVEDGISAEAQMRDGDYAVVILDILLPGQSGLAVLKQMSRAASARPRIVAVSGGGDDLTGASALDLARVLGADRVLYKPFTSDELMAAVRGES